MIGFGGSSFSNLIGNRNASALRLALLSTAWFPPASIVCTHLLLILYLFFSTFSLRRSSCCPECSGSASFQLQKAFF